jgi:hypothetical protein
MNGKTINGESRSCCFTLPWVSRVLVVYLNLLFLCSCATRPSRPADVKMNPDALRDGRVIVNLRLESGGDLPFLVDTGSPGTLFDKTLGSKLGWRLPIGSLTVRMGDGSSQKSGVYLEPNLYLGGTKLKTGRLCATYDFKGGSNDVGRPIVGILAMDCLRHYCIQLDFQTQQMRFLDRQHLDVSQIGHAYPLKVSHFYDSLFTKHAGLAGGKSTRMLVDTGDNSDGQIEKGVIPATASDGWAHLPQCVWDGQYYTNLDVAVGRNAIGLRFLARHLVTFDFPNSTMYLKQTSAGPFSDVEDEEFAGAFAFLTNLKKAGQQPGWSKTDHGNLHVENHPDSNTFAFAVRKEGDPTFYHYTVTRASKDSPWKLQKAWRTDKKGTIIEEFPSQ